jgi:hypothetical protein
MSARKARFAALTILESREEKWHNPNQSLQARHSLTIVRFIHNLGATCHCNAMLRLVMYEALNCEK